MAILAPAVDSFVGGLSAIVNGVEKSIQSPTIRGSYVSFTLRFFVITVLGYAALSATMITFLPAMFILALGPCLGPVAFIGFSYVLCTALLILWLMGRFPMSSLFVGSYGILRPFFSVTQMSFLLSSVLMPMGCDGFMLAGIEAVYEEKGVETGRIRATYKKPGKVATTLLGFSNAAFDMALKAVVMFLTWGKFRSVVDPALSAFLLGSQLASVYTVRVRKMSYFEHISWCARNALGLIGFTFPLQLASENFGWFGTVMSLGLGYAAASALVEDLVIEEYGMQHTEHAHVY